LLKDRELAKFAGTTAAEAAGGTDTERRQPVDKEFDDLTVLAELERADNGVVFLWCPSCGNEIAHVGFEDKNSMSIFEVECQRCLTRLDQRAVVSIEVGYPIEERVVEETVKDDLKRCVIDYWHRSLAKVPAGSLDDEDIDEERLVWQYNEYVQEFGWEWPADVPVVGLRPDETYRNEATGDRFEVLEAVTDNRGTLDDYRVRYDDDEVAVLEADELLNLVLGRSLYLTEEPIETAESSTATK
jgi:hypothetical protein